MNKYLDLIKASTPYALRMTYLRNRIFGDIVSPSDLKNKRIVELFQEKPIYKRNAVVNYYPRHMEAFHLMVKLRKYGLYYDEHYEFQTEMKAQRAARGKVKPKKGCGKQATNK